MKIKEKISLLLIIILFLLPRIALLTNGLDAQRIWDTNVPAAFSFLQSLQGGELLSFLASDHKYPLLGSYLYVPVIGFYYLFGNFVSPDHFANSYALGETNLFFWIRLFVLFANLVSVFLLYKLTIKFTKNSKKAGLILLLLAGTSYYTTFFSVMPRIHSLAFFGTALTLYFSFHLVEKKSWQNYALAFGAAGFTLALSQSGIVNFILPVLAHFYEQEKLQFKARISNKKFWFSLLVSGLLAILVGYPQFVFSLLNLGGGGTQLLSSSHQRPTFALVNLFQFAKVFLWRTEIVLGFSLVIFSYLFYNKKVRLEIYDKIALAQVILFILVFGFSDVITGRFALVVLPAAFFVTSRLFLQIDKSVYLKYALYLLIALQAVGILAITKQAYRPDTRQLAAQYVLENTEKGDSIATSIDFHLLGLVANKESLQETRVHNIGKSEERILQNNLENNKSRYIIEFEEVEEIDQTPKFLILEKTDSFDKNEAALKRLGYKKEKEILSSFKLGYTAWGSIPDNTWLPMFINLWRYRAMGPNIIIFAK